MILLIAVSSACFAADCRNMSAEELNKACMEFSGPYETDPALGIPYFEEVLRRGRLEFPKWRKVFEAEKDRSRKLRARGIKVEPQPLLIPQDLEDGDRLLFVCYTRLGQFEEAAKYRQEFFSALDESGLSESRCEGRKAEFFHLAGMLAQALPHYQRSLETARSSLDRSIAVALLSGAMVEFNFLDPRLSEGVMELALKLLASKEMEPDDRSILLQILELTASRMGDHEKVIEYGEKFDASKGGPNFYSLTGRLPSYAETGRWEKGRDLMLKFLAPYSKSKKATSRELYANHMTELALIAAKLGNDAECRSLLKRADPAIASLDDPVYQWGSLPKAAQAALQIRDAALAQSYLDQFRNGGAEEWVQLIIRSLVRQELGRSEENRRARESYLALMRENYPNSVRYLSEIEIDQIRAGYLSEMLNTGNDALSVEAVMLVKGLASDLKVALLADRSNGAYDSQNTEWRERWHLRRAKLQTLTLKGSKALTPDETAEMSRLTAEIAAMEMVIGGTAQQQAVMGTLERTVDEWAGLLREGGVAANFIRYDKLTPSPESSRMKDILHTDPWYGVALFGGGVEPKFIEIGAASVVEPLCEEFRILVNGESGEDEDAAIERVCRQLYSLVAQPLEAILPPEAPLIYSPEGLLHLIPLASLIDEAGAPWLGSRSLRQVTSFRFLTSGDAAPAVIGPGDILLVGGVDYLSTTGETVVSSRDAGLRSGIAEGLQGLSSNLVFTPLLGTLTEVDRIEALCRPLGWTSVKQSGSAATESLLSEAKSHRIVHLATHGFFFDPQDGAAGGGEILSIFHRKYADPLAFTGVALAGAQQTLQAWRRGDIPPLGSDGLLLASELAGLKLGGVDLLVLSACETGLGSLSAGEAVSGFAKACAQAGVNRTMVTLWPISDEATVSLMETFYRELFADTSANDALRKAQLEHFAQTREASGLRSAVNTTMPFVLIGKVP